MKNTKRKVSVLDITLVGMMVAIIEVSKLIIAWLPNIELVSFLIIIFTIFFGRKMFFVLPVFILIEGLIYGFEISWIMYLYMWPMLSLIAWIFRKNENSFLWAIISGVFGYTFGFFCSIPYFVLGAIKGGIYGGISSAIGWWISGIPYDLIHGTGNFIIILVLFRPVRKVMNLLVKNLL